MNTNSFEAIHLSSLQNILCYLCFTHVVYVYYFSCVLNCVPCLRRTVYYTSSCLQNNNLLNLNSYHIDNNIKFPSCILCSKT